MGDDITDGNDDRPSPLRPEEFAHQVARQEHERKLTAEEARRNEIAEKHGSAIESRLRNVDGHDDEEQIRVIVDCVVNRLAEKTTDYSHLGSRERARLLSDATTEARAAQQSSTDRSNDRSSEQPHTIDRTNTSHGTERPANYYSELKGGPASSQRGETNDRTDDTEREAGERQMTRAGRQIEGQAQEAGREISRPTDRNGGGRR